jgi:hypothetical protein
MQEQLQEYYVVRRMISTGYRYHGGGTRASTPKLYRTVGMAKGVARNLNRYATRTGPTDMPWEVRPVRVILGPPLEDQIPNRNTRN